MKFIYLIAFIVMAIVVGAAGYLFGLNQVLLPKTQQTSELALTDKAENVIAAKLKVLAALASDPVVVQAVVKSNKDNQSVTQPIINQRDQAWRQGKSTDSIIKPYLTNAAAQSLVKFQQANPSFTEIFVADARGLNVSVTDKTSDYYQADEAWWQQSFNNGQGKAFHGNIMYDTSSQSEAFPLYQPVFDPASHKAIGVLKADLDINAVKAGL